MLVDLQAFDVVVCHTYRHSCQDHQRPDARLSIETTAEAVAADHQRSDVGNEGEKDDRVAVDAMKEKKFVSNGRDELPDHEEACW